MPCRIELSQVELELHVGCTEEERLRPQPVLLRVAVHNPETFPASRTDRLEDTIDASSLRAALVEQARASRATTLERLGQLLEDALRERFPGSGLDWELTLGKPRFGWAYVHAWRS